MPSGITHDRITMWTLPWVTGGTYFLTRHGELTLIVASSFIFSGLMFGPDLDIHSLQYKRWGVLRIIWIPYRKMLRHRSLFSHGPIIGTLVRVFYLLTIVSSIAVFGVAIAQLIWGFEWNWQQFFQEKLSLMGNKYAKETLALFVGLELGAMSHSLSDWVSSTSKYQRKKKLKKDKTTS